MLVNSCVDRDRANIQKAIYKIQIFLVIFFNRMVKGTFERVKVAILTVTQLSPRIQITLKYFVRINPENNPHTL